MLRFSALQRAVPRFSVAATRASGYSLRSYPSTAPSRLISRRNKSTFTVGAGDDGAKLLPFLKRKMNGVPFSVLQRALRKSNVLVNGVRTKDGKDQLQKGSEIRVLGIEARTRDGDGTPTRKHIVSDPIGIWDCVIYADKEVMVLNKPPGVAVQGGSKVGVNIDGLLHHLADYPTAMTPHTPASRQAEKGSGRPKATVDEADLPRLVHRIDKDTSGVLLVARSRRIAGMLNSYWKQIAESVQSRSKEARVEHSTGTQTSPDDVSIGGSIRKCYWALVEGVPPQRTGIIDVPLMKTRHPDGHDIVITREGSQYDGLRALTQFRVHQVAADESVSWVVFYPITGRTHQIRAHASFVLGTPLIGDVKYGYSGSQGRADLCLHARSIAWKSPSNPAKWNEATAPVPKHMAAMIAKCGWSQNNADKLDSYFTGSALQLQQLGRALHRSRRKPMRDRHVGLYGPY